MQKIVLVTGASSGIGFDTVRILTENNFKVIATVRKEEDKQNLIQHFSDKVIVLILDVTNFNDVEKIPAILKNEHNIEELFALVNNAGVALAAPFAYQDFAEVQNLVQVNLLSVFKITQVLIPILKGRIINLSSISGKSAAPFLSIYAATKHAIEGFSEGIRKELMLLDIKVIVIAPGSIKTPIWQKGFEVIKNKYAKTKYAKSFEIFMKIVASEVKHALPVSEVSDCILEALTAENPKFRYAPMPRKLINWYLPMLVPAKLYNRLTAKTLKLYPNDSGS